MYGLYYDPTSVLLIPAIIFTLFAQAKVKSAYRKYSGVRNSRGITGMQAARRILDANGLQYVNVEMTPGTLSDHYNESSIAAVSIAAHECGHAIQHARGYSLLKFRNTIVPVVNFASKLSWPLLIIGLIISATGSMSTGYLIFDIGVLFFAAVVVFHLVTLPVELNASSRAIAQMQQLGIVGMDEVRGSRKVLSAAAMTYLAALATAVLELIRLLILRERY